MNYKIKFKITNLNSEIPDDFWEEELQLDCPTEKEAHDQAHAILEDRYPNLSVECLACVEAPIQSKNRPANVFNPADLKSADDAQHGRETKPSRGQGYD